MEAESLRYQYYFAFISGFSSSKADTTNPADFSIPDWRPAGHALKPGSDSRV